MSLLKHSCADLFVGSEEKQRQHKVPTFELLGDGFFYLERNLMNRNESTCIRLYYRYQVGAWCVVWKEGVFTSFF